MRNQMKQKASKLFSFCMAVVMVLTSLTITPLTVDAKEEGAALNSETTVSGMNLTVHFKNEKQWDTVYAKFAGDGWAPLKGFEYCKNYEFGGIIHENEKNAGWYSFKIETDETATALNGLFNSGFWYTEAQTGNYGITNPGQYSEVWITYAAGTGNDVTVSYSAPGDWVTGAAVTAPTDASTVTVDTGINNPAKTKLKLYYYIMDEDKNPEDYALNVWGGAALTEAGTKLTVTAWNNQQYRKLLPASVSSNTVEGLDGRWAYVGLDGSNIEGMQFVTVDGGENVWNSGISVLGLSEAYYVPGYGWFTEPTCNEKNEVQMPSLQDVFYIVGGSPDSSGNASLLGNWNLEEAVLMTKVSDATYQVEVALTAGTYEYTPVQDPVQFAWKHQFKDYEHMQGNGAWPNYSVTVSENATVRFTVKDPDISTGKALVTAVVLTPDTDEGTGNGNSGNGNNGNSNNENTGKKFTVTFKDGTTVLKTESVENGKAATAPELPTKQGYTAGWDKGFSKITADTVITVTWTPNEYKLTYNVNGGSKLKTTTKTITYDSTLGDLEKAKRKGYSLKGWYTKKKGGTRVTEATKVTGDITVYAQWKKVTKPGKVTIKKVKNVSKKTIRVTLKKVKGADGYQVRYSTDSDMKKTKVVTTEKTAVKITGLKKGKTYYVKVRAYKLDSAGKKVYSAKYSKVKRVTIKK